MSSSAYDEFDHAILGNPPLTGTTEMSAERVDMHRLQELVRLHRIGERCHAVVCKLKMVPESR